MSGADPPGAGMAKTFSAKHKHEAAGFVVHRLFLTTLRPMLATISLYASPVCSALPTSMVPEGATFYGMNALVANGVPARPLHILAVHGMGTTTPEQFESFIGALANRLRLVEISNPRGQSAPPFCGDVVATPPTLVRPLPTAITITGVPPEKSAELYTYTFASRDDASMQARADGQFSSLGAADHRRQNE